MGPEEELEEYDRRKCWPSVFQHLRLESIKKHDFSLKDSRRPEFRGRNRYGDVSPYDDTRVHLQRNGIDYINASIVKSELANRTYLLTQATHYSPPAYIDYSMDELNYFCQNLYTGPLPDTTGHFWLMVWEQNSRAILMLNRVIEKEQIKCHQYYPIGQNNEGEDEMIFNDVGLKVTFIEERDANYHYTARVLHVHDLESQETREVIQFHYTAWPDFGVPECPDAFLDFLFAVRQSGALSDPLSLPIIHCSAGIGRSGTFCLVDTCLVLIEQDGSTEGVNVLDLLMDMRRYRMGLIQTADQLRFSYLAIVEGARRIGLIPASGTHRQDSAEPTSVEGSDSDPGGGEGGGSDEDSSDADIESASSSGGGSPPPLPPRRVNDPVCIPSDPIWEAPRSTEADIIGETVVWCQKNGTSGGTVIIQSRGDADTNKEDDETHRRGDKDTNRGDKQTDVMASECDRVKPDEEEVRKAEHVDEETDNNVAQEIKRRSHDERIKNTAAQIALMKRRQQESELWQTRRRQITPYVVGGVSAAVAVGSYLLYRSFSI